MTRTFASYYSPCSRDSCLTEPSVLGSNLFLAAISACDTAKLSLLLLLLASFPKSCNAELLAHT